MSTQPQGFSVRPLTDEDWDALQHVDSHAFGMTIAPEVTEHERPFHQEGRDIGAYDGTTLAGIAGAYSFDVRVPGATVPSAGVTWVGVLPTHRRRGVLRTLMTHQLHEIHERGREATAVLWASEPAIYGRFGYGLASRAYGLTVPRDPRALRDDVPVDPTLRLRIVDPNEWKLVADVYATAVQARPGMVVRDDMWHARGGRDHPSLRDGFSALRCVVAEDDGGVRGYARYATKPDWSAPHPNGEVMVREVIAADAPAYTAVLRFLFDLDLMGRTVLSNVAVDDPMLHWLADPRVAQPTLKDALYVRLVDVPRALRERTYSAPVDVVVEVADPLCPWNDGRWRLRGDASGGECEATTDDADLALLVRDLGAAYLGGVTLAELAAAGWVEERTPDALMRASAAFATSPAPWCPFIF